MARTTKHTLSSKGIRVIPRHSKSAMRDPEKGDVAVTIAVIAVLLLVLIPLVTYAASTNLLPLTRGNQDYQNALAAAESGIAVFINEINTDPTSPPTLSTSSWEQVTGSQTEYYYYTATFNNRNNSYNIVSSGISLRGKQTYTRTVQETITPASYTSYELYYDSSLLSGTMAALTGCDPTTGPCYWTLNNLPPGQSTPGTFYTGGDYFLNQGGSFNGAPSGVRLETGGKATTYYTGTAPNQVPNTVPFCTNSGWYKFQNSGSGACGPGTSSIGPTSSPISLVPQVSWPPAVNLASDALGTETPATTPSAAGCYYVGPTQITMAPPTSPGNPAFYVYSPYSTLTNVQNYSNYDNCGGSAVTSSPGVLVNTSPGTFNGAVYVGQAPSLPLGCTLGTVPAYLYNYPTYSDAPPAGSPSNSCAGTLLINGTSGGQITLGAQGDVIVDGNLMYADCSSPNLGNDVTGLVAGQDLGVAVTAWNGVTNAGKQPYSSNSLCTNVTGNVATTAGVIMGALFALNGSLIPIETSTCTNGGFSKLVLYGNIAAGSAGLNGFPSNSYTCVKASFNNALTYDQRLAQLAPPEFPFPVATFSSSATWKEISNPATLPALP